MSIDQLTAERDRLRDRVHDLANQLLVARAERDLAIGDLAALARLQTAADTIIAWQTTHIRAQAVDLALAQAWIRQAPHRDTCALRFGSRCDCGKTALTREEG